MTFEKIGDKFDFNESLEFRIGAMMKDQAFKIDEKFTYQDYLHLPEDGKRYQIIDGELHMVHAPIPDHQRILRKLGRILDQFVTDHGIGEVFYSPCDVVLSEVDVVQPDIFLSIRKD